jgi:serine/threonine protein phosphatase 1
MTPAPQYVIGDIHGQIDMLDQALAWIEADGGRDARVIFLGDLVDRGADSRGVIDRVMQGIAQGRDWRVVLGNHDRMFARFLQDGEQHDPRIKSGIGWLHPRLGGVQTLASYGVAKAADRPLAEVLDQARAAVPQAHRDFISALPRHIEQDGLLFVHAGIRPGVPLAHQDPEDLIWIRDGFLEESRPHPWLVVHGHTAIDLPFHYGNRVNLDGGAGYGRTLYPVVFEGTSAWMLDEAGRLPLVP